jgi:hypothetical protein
LVPCHCIKNDQIKNRFFNFVLLHLEHILKHRISKASFFDPSGPNVRVLFFLPQPFHLLFVFQHITKKTHQNIPSHLLRCCWPSYRRLRLTSFSPTNVFVSPFSFLLSHHLEHMLTHPKTPSSVFRPL